MTRFTLLITAAFASIVLLGPAASAESILMTATLAGTNEVPPNDRSATGSASLNYDSESGELSWRIDYDGLSGPLIGAHIHGPAGSSANAGILLPLDEKQKPIIGKLVLSDEQAAHMLEGNTYINLHTEAHPGGEIRGQIVR